MTQALAIRDRHMVECWNCGREFDLIIAAWCGCGVQVERPSKVCPRCHDCICLHPDYNNEAVWGSAPNYLKRQKFNRLFYLYL